MIDEPLPPSQGEEHMLEAAVTVSSVLPLTLSKTKRGRGGAGGGGAGAGATKMKRESLGKDEGDERLAGMKRPKTVYLQFCHYRREQLLLENPSLTFSELSKIMAAEFKTISAEERARLTEICASEGERFKNDLISRGLDPQEFAPKPKAKSRLGRPVGSGPSSSARKTLAAMQGSEDSQMVDLPLARIKKIMKLDPEVKNIASDAILAVAKCTEVFLGSIARKSFESAIDRGSKSIHLVDVLHTVQTTDAFEFLRLDLRKDLNDNLLDGSGIGSGKNGSGANALKRLLGNSAMDDLPDGEIKKKRNPRKPGNAGVGKGNGRKSKTTALSSNQALYISPIGSSAGPLGEVVDEKDNADGSSREDLSSGVSFVL